MLVDAFKVSQSTNNTLYTTGINSIKYKGLTCANCVLKLNMKINANDLMPCGRNKNTMLRIWEFKFVFLKIEMFQKRNGGGVQTFERVCNFVSEYIHVYVCVCVHVLLCGCVCLYV